MRIFALTPGDPGGIGPEITWKTLRARGDFDRRKEAVLCIGAREPFQRLKARIIPADPSRLVPPRERRPHVWLLEAPAGLPGFQAGWSIETATRLIQKGAADALVTGPISKERLQQGGFRFSGHTDFLAHLCGGGDVTMMLANEKLRVSLVTVHTALSRVPGAVTAASIERAVEQTLQSLRSWFGIRKPRIAIAALNPHAGENGLFGDEDDRVVRPSIDRLRSAWAGKAEISGPHPSDTLFAKHVLAKPKNRYDAVVCMYHDQGLIPVKLLDFPRTVNITLGLPIVRTSVDHGTGFDIAGKNLADPSSMRAALRLAARISSQKNKEKKTRP